MSSGPRRRWRCRCHRRGTPADRAGGRRRGPRCFLCVRRTPAHGLPPGHGPHWDRPVGTGRDRHGTPAEAVEQQCRDSRSATGEAANHTARGDFPGPHLVARRAHPHAATADDTGRHGRHGTGMPFAGGLKTRGSTSHTRTVPSALPPTNRHWSPTTADPRAVRGRAEPLRMCSEPSASLTALNRTVPPSVTVARPDSPAVPGTNATTPLPSGPCPSPWGSRDVTDAAVVGMAVTDEADDEAVLPGERVQGHCVIGIGPVHRSRE